MPPAPKQFYDVAIVGAGPAGGIAAYETARAGCRTAIFEEDPTVGVPVQCGEGISEHAFRNLNLTADDTFIASRINTLQLFFPEGYHTVLQDPGYELNRDKFDQHLVNRALTAGAELFTSTKITALDHARMQLAYETRTAKGVVGAGIVIGCDGPKSQVATWTGLLQRESWTKKIIRAIEYRIRGVSTSGFDFYFLPKFSPGGYCWVFRKGENVSNVGIATTAPGVVERLKTFMSHNDIRGQIEKTTAGGIPSWGPIDRTFADGVLIAGDAAGHTNPVFLGGIHTAMLAGRLAGQVAVEALNANDTSAEFLARYEKRWRALPMADPVLIEAKRILYEMTERELIMVGRSLANRDLTRLGEIGKLMILVQTLRPSNWGLLTKVPELYKLVRGLSITRRWGW
jgi:digeranylgeranylglycerophospholipid reductase